MSADKYISLWQLAREQRTYPDLLRGLAKFFDVPIEGRGSGRRVTVDNAQILKDLLWCRRSTPTVSQMLGQPRRRRRRKRR